MKKCVLFLLLSLMLLGLNACDNSITSIERDEEKLNLFTDFLTIEVDLVKVSNNPSLQLTYNIEPSKYKGEVYELVVVNGDEEYVASPTENSRSCVLVVNLTQLQNLDSWYDVKIRNTTTGQEQDLLENQTYDYRKTIAGSQKIYEFKEWDGWLKVNSRVVEEN